MRLPLSQFNFLSKLFLSFACLTTIPLLVVGMVSDTTLLRYSEDELSKSFINNLKSSEQVFQMWNDEVCKQSISLLENSPLEQLRFCTDYNTIIRNADTFQLVSGVIDQLEQATYLNSKCSSITLYLNGSNYIINSQSGALTKQDYLDTSWLEEYQQKNPLSTSPVWRITRNAGVRNEAFLGREYLLSYIYPIAPYTTAATGFVITNIRESSLCSLLNSGEQESSDAFVLDSRGVMISHQEKSLLEQDFSDTDWYQKISTSPTRSGSVKLKEENGEYLYSYYRSRLTDWIYISRYSLKDLTGQIHSQRILLIGITVLLIAFGLTASYLLSRFLYHPIRTLANRLNTYFRPPTRPKNDLALISDTFENMIFQVERGKADNLENTLLKLLNGGAEIAEAERSTLLKEFYHSDFCCVLIRLDDPDVSAGFKTECFQKLLSTLGDRQPQCLCRGISLGAGDLGIILNFDEADTEGIFQTLRQIQQEFLERLDCSFSVSVGGIKKSAGKIYHSYQQAVRTMQKRMLTGYNSFLFYRQGEEEKRVYFYPVETETSIRNNLQLRNSKQITDQIQSLTLKIREEPNISPDNVRQIFNELIGIAIRYLIENHINTQKVFGGRTNLYYELSKHTILQEMEKFLLWVYQEIIQYLDTHSSSGNERVQKMKEYIYDHYHEDIELSVLADHVGLSVSHMRRIFTEETGENILYFINRLRIDEGKRLLSETNKSILAIASEVGYFNKQSFNRFFKKYEGITPSEYRMRTSHPEDGKEEP